MGRKTFVAGVGMIPFQKPGASAPYDEMGAGAVSAALADAGLGFAETGETEDDEVVARLPLDARP